MGRDGARIRVARGGRRLRAAEPARQTVVARGWPHNPRFAAGCAAATFAALLLIDGCTGGLTPARAALWAGVAAVLLLVLWPVRVTAGPGWLAVRGLLRTRRVRTDALAGAWRVGNVSAALVLKDVYGGRVELAPEILLTNPLVWHLVDAGARRSRERGTLRTGGALLDRIGRLIDAQAGMILRTSGLR